MKTFILLINALLAALIYAAPVFPIRKNLRDIGHNVAQQVEDLTDPIIAPEHPSDVHYAADQPLQTGHVVIEGTGKKHQEQKPHATGLPLHAQEIAPKIVFATGAESKKVWATGTAPVPKKIQPIGTAPAVKKVWATGTAPTRAQTWAATGTAPSAKKVWATGTAPVRAQTWAATGTAPVKAQGTGNFKKLVKTGTAPKIQATGTAPTWSKAVQATGTAPAVKKLQNTGIAPSAKKPQPTGAAVHPAKQLHPTEAKPSHAAAAPPPPSKATKPKPTHSAPSAVHTPAAQKHEHHEEKPSSTSAAAPAGTTTTKSPGSPCHSEEKSTCQGPAVHGSCQYKQGHWRWSWTDVPDGSICHEGHVSHHSSWEPKKSSHHSQQHSSEHWSQ